MTQYTVTIRYMYDVIQGEIKYVFVCVLLLTSESTVVVREGRAPSFCGNAV